MATSYEINLINHDTFIPCLLTICHIWRTKIILTVGTNAGSGMTWSCLIPPGTYFSKDQNDTYASCGKHETAESIFDHVSSVNPGLNLKKCMASSDVLALINILIQYHGNLLGAIRHHYPSFSIDVRNEFDRLFRS